MMQNLKTERIENLLDTSKNQFSSWFNQNGEVGVTFFNSSKKINVQGRYNSNGSIIIDSGYFLYNQIHRYRKDGNDVNASYYNERNKLLLSGSIIIEKKIADCKFFKGESDCEIYRIQNSINFESLVFATSTITGNWTWEIDARNFWKLNNYSLSIGDIIDFNRINIWDNWNK